jgi:predicted NACHT family NTPase
MLTIEQLKTEIFAHWIEESWHEVLCLLSGMIAPRFVAEVLVYLLQEPDSQHTCKPTFLAARCVGEVRKRNELGSIAGEILDRVKALVRFDLKFVCLSTSLGEKRGQESLVSASVRLV